jgi:hypothetical protein
MNNRWFAFEAVVLCAPAVLFLGATLPEVLRATRFALHFREASPELSAVQATSALWQWAAGAFALSILVGLAVASVRRRVFRYGLVFWVALVTGLACAWSMVGPFGAGVAFAVNAPLIFLALHASYVQSRLRSAL